MSATLYSILAGLVLTTAKQNEGLDLVPTKKSASGAGAGGGGGVCVGSSDCVGGGRASATPSGGTWRPRNRGVRGYGWRGRHHY